MTSPHPVFFYREDGRVDYAAMAAAANKAANRMRAERMRAEAAVIAAAAVRALQGQVQPAFRPPAGRLWKVDAEAQMIVGPAGGIGTTPVIVRTLEALATPGRHDEGVVAAAGGWRDVAHLREAMTGLAPKLAVIGLRLDRRKTGIRITKARAQLN
ncbi:hypothetical protein ASF28_18655 [Methylobacterium sp. Leaf99]|uniref:hypothetical protein n=1 Tax=Methylobacterium sp. Leaf99 TaxID=1736251 RepID=UPI0007017BAD|nr:hypothetical protein [Methylobacterium sp. Leaf99]KQP05910.1 hypothetical protein ASF28_18655 [Methylobacterium sp. Leaf99]